MTSKKLQTIKGRILLIQEERFRLMAEKGQGYLFTLSHHASSDIEDLEGWREAGRPVIVEYEGKANFQSAVALSVRPAFQTDVEQLQ